MPFKLEEIEPDEISLVDVPATKRKFLFRKADVDEEVRTLPNGLIECPSCGFEEALIDFVKSASEECPECGENLISSDTEITFKKRRSKMKKISEIIKSFLEDDDEELTDEELEALEKADKKMPPEAAKALKGALSLLSKYKGQYPDDVKAAINTLAKFASYGYAAEKADEDGDLFKAGAKLSKDTVSKLKKIFDILKGAPEAVKLLKEMIPSEHAKSAELESKLDTVLDEIKKLKKGADTDEDEDEDTDEDEDEDKKKAKDPLMKKLNALEKIVTKIAEAKGLKKSLKGSEEEEEDEEEETDVKKKGKTPHWGFSFAPIASRKKEED